ncbi:hypothetical protein BDW59DRAFT_165695 [Aspergillus cavernicola]|uniref:Ysc84 actin-binding domain-containing protein n=1 Tax=Aspergillus cavernicola TaxID=176166 RepID=A0ABR4HR67_9EURO
MPKGMHNPLPASLRTKHEGECKKATQILESFIHGSWRGSPGRELPERVLSNAKALAILTVTKAGILGTLRFGSGLLIARLPDGTWSCPSAIGLAGLGFGGQAGFELTDFVFILNDAESVKTFSRLGSLTVSGNFSIAFGPVGRNAEIAGGVNGNGGGKMMSFAKTKGLFGGVSFESGMLVERRWANRRFYGKKVKAGEVLGGDVTARVEGEGDGEGVEELEGLRRVLEEVFAPVSEQEQAVEPTVDSVEENVPVGVGPQPQGPESGSGTGSGTESGPAAEGGRQT